MSGHPRGHVTLQAGEETYTLVFSVNAICRAEDRLNKGIGEIADQIVNGGRLGCIRAVIWAGLGDKHPTMTEADVGNLIDQIGLDNAGSLVKKALQVAFPDAFGQPEGGEAGPPRKAPRKADGNGSSSPGAP